MKKYRFDFGVLRFIYALLGPKVLFGILLSIIVGVLDGFGLSVFLPLIQNTSSNDPDNKILSFISHLFKNLNLEINLYNMLIFISIIFTLKGIAKYCNFIFRVFLQQKLIGETRKNVLNFLDSIKYSLFTRYNPGKIQNILTSETDRLQQAFSLYSQTLEQLFLVVVYLLFALIIDRDFAMIVVGSGLIISLSYRFIYASTLKRSVQFSDGSNFYQGIIMELIKNFKYLKATGEYLRFANKAKHEVNKLETIRKRMGLLSGIMEGVREPVMIFILSLSIYIQIELFEGNISSILISLLFFYRAVTSLSIVQTTWNRYLEVSGSAKNVIDFYNELKSNCFGVSNQKDKKADFSKIELVNVSFKHKDRSVLNNINLTLKKGSKTAIVGQSGSGKSTLVDILAGLFDDYSGSIIVGSVDFVDLDKQEYRSNIGYITQDAALFQGTIIANVTMASEKINNDERSRCYEALVLAGLKEFVDELDLGMNTVVGSESGVSLSGGQRQRLMIARELYKKPKILLIDESTSALDLATQKKIMKTYKEINNVDIMVIISHDIKSLDFVDNILTLDEGKIVLK